MGVGFDPAACFDGPENHGGSQEHSHMPDDRAAKEAKGMRARRSTRHDLLVMLAAAAAMTAAGANPALPQDQIGIPLGETPEAVQIEDLDGAPVDLGEYIGRRPVLVEFWATWCPLCRALEPGLREAYARYGEEVEFLVVAVAVNQNPRRIKRHLESHPMPGRVLWDEGGRAVRAFMTPTTSYVVVLDAEGRVVYTGLGEDQDIEAAVRRAVDS